MAVDDPQSAANTEKGLAAVCWLHKVSPSGVASVILVALAVGVAIWVLIREGSFLLSQSIRLSIPLVFLAFFVACAGLGIAIPVWRRILACHGIRQSARNDVRIYCYSALGAILPGGIWSVVSRSALYQRLGVDSLRVALASMVEMFVIGIAATGVYAIVVMLRPDVSMWQQPVVGLGFSLVVLLLFHPRVFNSLGSWIFERSGLGREPLQVNFSWRDLGDWVGLESIVILIGGLALFVLLNSLISVQQAVLMQVIAAWAAASAVSNLFFWLPGTSVLRDGVMVVALTPSLPLPVALLFVVLARIWIIASLLTAAGLAWLLLDRPYHTGKNGD